MAPPEDDSQQWYVTVWGHSKDPATAAIVKGFESDANLSPFVAAPPAQVAGQAWAHFNVYYADDPTQAFRFKDFAIPLAGPFPILTIQPPRDGSFGGLVGDKAADGTKITRAVVVDRLDAKAIGQPPDLRRRITASVALWCRKLQESGFQPPAKLAQRVSGPRTDAGQKRAMGGSHGQGPAGFPWGPQTPPAQPQVNPQWPAGGPATDPPVTPAPGLPDSKLLTLLFYLLTGHGSFMDYLLLGAAVVTVVLQLRKARVAKGETPIIGDKLAQILESLADILKGFNAPKETPKT
jgi:hypothetical protein